MREWYKLKARIATEKGDIDDLERLSDLISSFGKSAKTTDTRVEYIKNSSYVCCDVALSREEASVLLLSFSGQLILYPASEEESKELENE